MNYFGFVIQPNGGAPPVMGGGDLLLGTSNNGGGGGVNETPTTAAIKSEEEAMLERYGLSWPAINASGGKTAADNMTNILRTLEDDGIALTVRVPMASALLTWQSNCPDNLRSEVFYRHYFKMLEMIRLNLVEPDDYQNTDQSFGNQKPTYYLALALQRETQQSLQFRDKIQNDVITAIQYVLGRTVAFGDATIDSGNETPPSVRADTIKCLMRCLPIKVDDHEELRVIVAIHMDISKAASGSSSLRAEVLQRINHISIETEDDSLFEDHVDSLLDAIQQGHHEVFGLIKKCKTFFNETSEALDDKLDSLMDSVGFPDMSEMVKRIAELDPRRLVKCIPAMVKELHTSLIKHKVLILNVLLTVALVHIGPLVPYVASFGEACSFTPSLFVPLFKLLTVVGSSSNDSALQCLIVIAKIAKSGLVKDPAHQSALLEAVNVIKDSCQYCNIFKPDTIECFRECSAANPAIFKNIVTWNTGKSARKGDKQSYLVNAGLVAAPQTSWFGSSPMKPATATKKGMISPSPMSQNIAQLQDKDIDGTEATDDSHITDGSGLQASSFPAAAGYVNTPVDPAFSGLSTDSHRPPPNTPLNNYSNAMSANNSRNNTPMMLSSSKISSMRFDQTPTGESKAAEDTGFVSFSEFIARQKANGGGTPVTTNSSSNQPHSSALVSQKLDFSSAVGSSSNNSAASKSFGDIMSPINYNASSKAGGATGSSAWDVPLAANNGSNGFSSPSVKSTSIRESTPVVPSSSVRTAVQDSPSVRSGNASTITTSPSPSDEVAIKTKGGFFSAFFGRGRKGKVGAMNTPNKLEPIEENNVASPNLRTSASVGSVRSSTKLAGSSPTPFQESKTNSSKKQGFESPSTRTLNVGSSSRPMAKEDEEIIQLRARLAQLESQKSPAFAGHQ